MITEGAKVRFVPACMIGGCDTPAERAAKTVTGTIIFVNWNHRVFTVEYGERLIEAFKFSDIGKTVHICN